MSNTGDKGILSLTTKHGNLLNCLGIQPVFVENNTIPTAFMGFVYRVANFMRQQGKLHYMIRYTKHQENNDILQNAFHVKNAASNVVNAILKNSFSLKHDGCLDNLMENKPLLKQTIMYYLERIHYYISIGKGNFIITSRKDLYLTPLFTPWQVLDFQVYLVDESILPKNVLILGHRNSSVFSCPLVACPLIDKKHFDELCNLNGIVIDDIPFDKTQKYPIMSKYLELYSLYQSYLDNVEVPYWYIETFKKPTITRQQAYYTTLVFD